MEVRPELIAELREKFFKKLDSEGPPDARGFHAVDIDKIKNNDVWLKRFLEHNELNVSESLNMLWECCAWRRKMGVNDITEDTVRREYLEEGSFFAHGKDKDGKALLIIKSKLHVKGAKDFSELQKCVIYWFERLEREGNGNQISLFFDMAESGLSNLDMEFTKYLIGLFKSYYPNFLNYILIFEMPWMLNAAFKIITSWLPAKAIPKMKCINKTTLKEFVDANNALKSWGGNNDYTFSFVPESQTLADAASNGKLDNKKVHFAENSPLSEQAPTGFGDQTNKERLLSVEPNAITFNKDGSEISGTITLQNITSDKHLSFKIKTTAPEKFKVRPTSGVLSPSEQRYVTVILQPGYDIRGLLHNDRFLVMCLPIKNVNATQKDLAAIWKSETAVEQHRLQCYNGESGTNNAHKSHSILLSKGGVLHSLTGSSDNPVDTFFSKIASLEDSYNKLHNEILSVKYLLLYTAIVLTILTAIATVYVWKIDVRESTDEPNCHIHEDM